MPTLQDFSIASGTKVFRKHELLTDTFPNVSKPQFLHLSNGDNNQLEGY